VIGLEVHCQLETATKIFCGCANRFGDPPNTNVCPVCLGLPGTLPVLSKQAVALAVRAALATGCEVQERSYFARKNYFYPDLPKGFQISQYDRPLALSGRVELPTGGHVRIHRIHIEEDAGKLLHEGFSWSDSKSGVDFNRAGVPLIEIVTEPDIGSAEEAHAYLTELKALLVYAGVSDCNMEQGSLRCDANVSLRPRGSRTLGTRTEIKNLNSFRNVVRAIEHEARRQAALIEAGHGVVQETRLWDADRNETQPMRSKEEAEDYRYFPEPDLAPLVVEAGFREEQRAALPELPPARRRRFVLALGLPEYDAGVLTLEREVADYFEELAGLCGSAKAASNWVMNEVLRKLKEESDALPGERLPAAKLAALLGMVDREELSSRQAKEVFEELWGSDLDPEAIVSRRGLRQLSDEGAIRSAVAEVISASPDQVASYKGGKQGTLGWFVGQVMKKTGGRANPRLVNRLLREALDA
jgi:aspartyl-tRNA(Asn)/glutamyl-tRNA(Gln) amidotransferase subunit B